MTRQISKGRCTFCHRELSKASMARHLASCEQRIAIQGEIGSRQKAKKSKAFRSESGVCLVIDHSDI